MRSPPHIILTLPHLSPKVASSMGRCVFGLLADFVLEPVFGLWAALVGLGAGMRIFVGRIQFRGGLFLPAFRNPKEKVPKTKGRAKAPQVMDAAYSFAVLESGILMPNGKSRTAGKRPSPPNPLSQHVRGGI